MVISNFDKTKKIKLIVPPTFEGTLVVIPYGLALINAYLKKLGYEVDMDDIHMLIKRINNNRKTIRLIIDLNYVRELIYKKSFLLENYLLRRCLKIS